MCTPTDLEPRSGDLGPAEGVISPQDSAHERISRDEHGRRVESMPISGAPSDLVPTAPTQIAPIALPAHGPVLENVEQNGMLGTFSERQFYVDLHLGCEEILAESRTSKLSRTGSPAGKGQPAHSEIAQQALSLSMGFQSNEEPRELKEPF